MITLGNAAGDKVSIEGGYPSSGNTISVGNGGGDSVNVGISANNTIIVGNGGGDFVSLGGGFFGAQGNRIIAGNGQADVVNNTGPTTRSSSGTATMTW